MKVLLREKQSGRYYQSPSHWTYRRTDALCFDLVEQATAAAAKARLSGVELVVSFDNPPQDIVLGLAGRKA